MTCTFNVKSERILCPYTTGWVMIYESFAFLAKNKLCKDDNSKMNDLNTCMIVKKFFTIKTNIKEQILFISITNIIINTTLVHHIAKYW